MYQRTLHVLQESTHAARLFTQHVGLQRDSRLCPGRRRTVANGTSFCAIIFYGINVQGWVVNGVSRDEFKAKLNQYLFDNRGFK